MQLIFEWDKSKAKKNLQKHKVSFEEAKSVFADVSLITFPDDSHSDSEQRFISIGYSLESRILLVVHTENDLDEDKIIIRIISSRKATPKEKEIYEKG